MKLILTRHAKSSWDDLSLEDHERPLNDRGRAAATRVGHWIKGRRHVPQQILSSDAVRAQETASLLKEAMEGPEIALSSALYHASPDAILSKIRKCPPGDLMIVGHNPGIAAMAEMIVDVPPTHDRFAIYPTTATLIADIPVADWSELDFGMGRVVQFVVPRELKELHTT